MHVAYIILKVPLVIISKASFGMVLIRIGLIYDFLQRTESHTRPTTEHTLAHAHSILISLHPFSLVSCVATVFKSKCLSASNNSKINGQIITLTRLSYVMQWVTNSNTFEIVVNLVISRPFGYTYFFYIQYQHKLSLDHALLLRFRINKYKSRVSREVSRDQQSPGNKSRSKRVTSTNTRDRVTSTITISRVQTRDAGIYVCTATNKVTTRPIRQEITLVVQGNLNVKYIIKI